MKLTSQIYKQVILSTLVIVLLNSCASYNYSYDDDRSIKITSDNLPDFQVFSPQTSNKLSTASNGVARPRIEKLNKDYLTVLLSHPNYDPQLIHIKRVPRTKALAKDIGLGVFTFGIPVIVDVFNSDFYKVSTKTKEFNIHFEFKQSYMTDEYVKIKDSKNPEDFKTWLSKYTKSVRFQEATDKKDSLELSIALFQETESAIDDFIASHQTSNYLSQAQKIKDEMVAARELYAKTKMENTVIAYESFLAKYPRSLHNKEAHKLLTDAAEKVAVNSLNSSSMVNYMKTYLIPNSTFFNTSELDLRKSKISKAIDAQLIKENIKSDPKKAYDYYSNLWKAYNSIINQVQEDYLINFDQVLIYKPKIADLLFNKLKEATTAEKQSALISKINTDFPQFERWDKSKNVLITVLEESQKGNGTVKLFNIGFLPHYFDNMSERNALKGRNFYTYRGSDFNSLKDITYEEMSYLNGLFTGTCKAFSGDKLCFKITYNSNAFKEINYYQQGQLVKSTIFYPDLSSYEYEFVNGENITLKEINDVINQLTILENNAKKYYILGNYEKVIIELASVFKIVNPAINTLKSNPIPKEKAENLIIAKVRILDKLLNDAKVKISEKEKLIEQQRIAETKRIQLIADQNPTFNNGQKKYVRKNENGNWSSIPCYFDGEWQCWYCGSCVYTKGSGGWSAIPGSYSNTCDIRKGGQYCSRSCASNACLADL